MTQLSSLLSKYSLKDSDVEIINTPLEAAELVSKLFRLNLPASVDVETVGVDPSIQSPVGRGDIFCWSIGYVEETGVRTHPTHGTPLAKRVFIPNWGMYAKTILPVFKPWLESNAPKGGHNFTTFDMHVFRNHGIEVGGVVFDTLRMSKLAHSDKNVNHGLKFQADAKFGYSWGSIKTLFSRPQRNKSKRYKKDMSFKPKSGPLAGVDSFRCAGEVSVLSETKTEVIPFPEIIELYPQRVPDLVNYATWDAKATLELYFYYKKDMESRKRLSFYQEEWHPALLVLNDIEDTGMLIDVELANSKADWATADLRDCTDECNDNTESPIENWGSYQQLCGLLYGEMELPIPPIKGTLRAVKKTQPGETPTGEASLYWLEMYCHERRMRAAERLLAAIRRRRKTVRYLGYLQDFPTRVGIDRRLHPVLAPETDTGRLSAKLPPLQQVPGSDPYRIREIFVAAPGHKLIVADYSQLEVYVMAHMLRKMFNDDSLAEALESGDVYASVAKRIWSEQLDGVGAADIKHHPNHEVVGYRKLAKIVVLATNYLKTAQGLALSVLDEIGQPQTLEWGQNLLDSYLTMFPGIKKFQLWMAAYARKHGGVPTLSGRFRPIPEAYSDNRYLLSKADRKAGNTPIQGSAADIVTRARLATGTTVRPGRPVNRDLWGLGCRTIMEIHDELVYECPEESASTAAGIIESALNSAWPSLTVPLRSEVTVCDNWAEGK